jgi:hypothetical protein
MQSFLASCLTALVIAVVAAAVLYYAQMPSEIAFTSPTGVRM